jgi:endonuclease YncB( thermonuclease family)
LAASYYFATEKDNEFVGGNVVRVMDGDTYELLLEDKTTVRVRMKGIDAPESGMPFSSKATEYLRELTRGQTIRLEVVNIDQYGRTIGYSWLPDGRELSREMIRAGLAWHYKQFNSNAKLAALEIEAREARRGLWADNNPHPPWEIRRVRRQGTSTRDWFEGTTDEDMRR